MSNVTELVAHTRPQTSALILQVRRIAEVATDPDHRAVILYPLAEVLFEAACALWDEADRRAAEPPLGLLALIGKPDGGAA